MGVLRAIKQLEGLPPYGPMAISFPNKWGNKGQEGIVVEFQTEKETWVGNFKSGSNSINLVHLHPNKKNGLVISGGNLWVVDADLHTAENVLSSIDQAIEVNNPVGWVFSLQGLAIARFGPNGIIWHTKRLSWDGFQDIHIVNNFIIGQAWSPLNDTWHSFRVDIFTGESTGGSFGDEDLQGWEKLAH